MKNESRIPRTDNEFDRYVNQTTDYLFEPSAGPGSTPNWTRLGLTATEATVWGSYRNTWIAKYAITQKNAERGTRDSIAIAEKNKARIDFTDWVTDPEFNKLDRIGASVNVTETDRAVFHIKLRADNRTTRKAPIADSIFFNLRPLGGGIVRASCRSVNDASRASIPASAKAVEIYFKINGTAPTSVADCDEQVTSTRALFNFDVHANNAGQRLYAYARWIDTSDTNRSSAWSEMVMIIVT
jgi:hypothetical protein